MPGIAFADFAIGGMGPRATHVAGFNRLHTLHFVENRLQAPEAAAAQGRDFKFVHMNAMID